MKIINQRRFLSVWHLMCFSVLLAFTACSGDSDEELLDFLTPVAGNEAFFQQGVSFEAANASQSITFEAGQSWEVRLNSTDGAWCRVAPSSGKAGKATITIFATANNTDKARTAQLRITSGTASKELTITQSAAQGVVVAPNGFSVSPEAPDADQALTITFKADAKSALYGYTGEVYAHMGVVSEDTWMFVPAEWTENLPKCKMTAGEENVWSITLSPSIRQWFGSGETAVTKVGIVVRNADGSKKGQDADHFIAVTDSKYKAFEPAEVKVASLPSGVQEGINIVDNSTVTLVFYDLDKNGKRMDFAHVVGDFNNWTLSNDEKSQMNRDEAASCWWITLTGLDANKEYAFQYYTGRKGGETVRMADAYTEKILDPDNDKWIPAGTYNESLTYPEGGRGIVSTFKIQQDNYNWKVADFKIANPEKLVIYELHLRDFTHSAGDYGDLNGVMGKLDYLKSLGVNAIELMPVQEFDGNDSWGYNPCFFFAMDKAYGTKTMYKQFIDKCHELGIAVILDVVYNHATGAHPFAKLYWNSKDNKTASNNPYFNVDAPHPYSVFHDFNHESELVRKFVKRNLQFLLEEYKVDGFRFDLTKGFTQKSSSESTASNRDDSRIAILKDYNTAIKAVKPDAYVILEHFCANDEEKELAKEGMHLWRNKNWAYCQSAMGYSSESEFDGMYVKESDGWVGFMESHDEERMAYKQVAYGDGVLKSSLADRMNQLEVNTAFFLTVPGPKMIWQFGELGYDVSIEEGGRTGKKPLHWEYLENADRKELHNVYTKLMQLRNERPALFENSAIFEWKVSTAYWNNGRSLQVETVTGDKVVVVGNFTHAEAQVDFPGTTGSWTNYITGKKEEVAAKVSLPAHSFAVFTNF